MITLAPDAILPDRPFTALEHTLDDLRVMNQMLAALRRHVADVVIPSAATNRDDRFVDPDSGGHYKIAIPDATRVTDPGDLVAVGFFGQARMDMDHRPIVDLENALIADLAADPGIVVYENLFWPSVGWGNLVLFGDWDAKDRWGRIDPRHAEAIRRSPTHYHSIRLHNGLVEGGLPGESGVRLVRTRYLDYSGDRPWRAVRYAG
jgi:hypothetical protein